MLSNGGFSPSPERRRARRSPGRHRAEAAATANLAAAPDRKAPAEEAATAERKAPANLAAVLDGAAPPDRKAPASLAAVPDRVTAPDRKAPAEEAATAERKALADRKAPPDRKTGMKIGYIVGSLSKESLNRGLAKAFIAVAPLGVDFVELPIADLPMYNRDVDGNWPQVALDFKQSILGVDGIVFITPEHNRMYSAPLANAIEWGSRPFGSSAWSGKPVAVTGTAPSNEATGLAQVHLRAPLVFCGSTVYPAEVYINAVDAGITPEGLFAESARPYLQEFISGFIDFVEEFYRD